MNFSHFRQRLLDELDKIEQSLQASQSAGETVMLDQSSVGRLTRMDAMQQQAMASELTERLQLSKRKAQAALNRLNAGTYGLCCACEADMTPPVWRMTQLRCFATVAWKSGMPRSAGIEAGRVHAGGLLLLPK